MLCSCRIIYGQADIAAAFINYCFGAGILLQFYIYFVINNVDSLADSIQRSHGVAASVFGYFSAVAGQSEYRICCYICADSQQRAVKSFFTLTGEIIPAVVHNAGSAIIYILRALTAF